MTSIDDVARHAGVSIKTVSRVINGGTHVSAATRQRVEASVRALDFHPHSWARSLARRRSQSIGVVIPVSPQDAYTHPFFFQVVRGISEVLEQQGYELLLQAHSQQRSFATTWKERRADGLIVMHVPARDPRILELLQVGTPVVLTCRPDAPGSELDVLLSWVDADHAAGAESATAHLLMLGHRRLALLNGPADLVVSQLRLDGFRRALLRGGVDLDDPHVTALHGAFSIEAGWALGSLLLDRPEPPTAVLCGDDMLAIGLIQAARERGLTVPEQLSVVGFDDIPFSRYVHPPLTTVRQPAEQKGQLAAQVLLRRLAGDGATAPEHHLLRTELVLRASTAPAPVRGAFPTRGEALVHSV